MDYENMTDQDLGLVWAADVVIKPVDPHTESAYRRGFHQALSYAYDLLLCQRTRNQGLAILSKAYSEAGSLRFTETDKGGCRLMAEIEDRVNGLTLRGPRRAKPRRVKLMPYFDKKSHGS